MRASRLLAILILLQNRGRLTAEYLAAEFEVSMRTIYRDIDALSASGVPVYADRGPGGGFALLDGYRTQLTGLAPEEAEAVLLIGLPEQAAAMGLGNATLRAREKLLAALPKARGKSAVRVEGRFHLDALDWYRSAYPVPQLGRVARAVLDQRQLAMTYSSWTARRAWTVDPYGIVLKGGDWYLVARGRGKLRTFKVAEIEAAELLETGFDVEADFNLAQWWSASQVAFDMRLRPSMAKLHVSPTGLRRLRLLGNFAAKAVADAEAADKNGWRIVSLPLESVDVAAPQLLGIGPEFRVIEPSDLREVIASLARDVLERIIEAEVPS